MGADRRRRRGRLALAGTRRPGFRRPRSKRRLRGLPCRWRRRLTGRDRSRREPVHALYPAFGRRSTCFCSCRRVPARLVVVPPRRGVVSTLTLRLATAAPFGLLWWSRDQVLELPRPLHVAPKAREHKADLHAAATRTKKATESPQPALSGDLRGVRPYQHGDGRRRVHWHATAHTGDLMIRESEVRSDDPVRIVARSRPEPGHGRQARRGGHGRGTGADEERTDGRARDLSSQRARVVAPVSDRLSAGRRLARAVGPVADLTGGRAWHERALSR